MGGFNLGHKRGNDISASRDMIGWVSPGEQGLMRSAGCLRLFEGCGEFNVKKDRKPPGVMRPQSTFPLTPPLSTLRALFLLLPLGCCNCCFPTLSNAAVAASSREISSFFLVFAQVVQSTAVQERSRFSRFFPWPHTTPQSFPNPTTQTRRFLFHFLFKASSSITIPAFSSPCVRHSYSPCKPTQTKPCPPTVFSFEVILSR